ncbi:MAG: hypothetical protein DRH37_04605 [Deltaproteobacteria bacterium]|nr:MAG: hypothetical protein DRH37_04605 [Deltaproteobacteria bacterium]
MGRDRITISSPEDGGTSPADINTPGKSTLITVLRWFLFVLVVSMLVAYFVRHLHEFTFILTIKLRYLIPAAMLKFLGLTIAALRFHLIVTFVSHKIPFLTAFRYFVVGQFLPHGGNVYRAVMLKKSDDISYRKYLSVLLSFKWINLAFTALLGTLIIGVLAPDMCMGKISALWLFASIFLILLSVIPLFRLAGKYLPTNPQTRGPFRVRTIVSRVLESTAVTIKNRPLLLKCFFFIFSNKCISIVTLYLLFRSIGTVCSLPALVIYMVILDLSGVITITPSNIGIREFLLGYLTLSMGITVAQGITVSIMLRMIKFTVQGTLSALLILTDRGKSRGSVDG